MIADSVSEQAGSIRHWPAAGGGILLSAHPAAFAAEVGLRNTPSLFLRLDHTRIVTAIVPYAELDNAARWHLLAILAEEFDVLEGRAPLHLLTGQQMSDLRPPKQVEGNLDPVTEVVVRTAAAALRSLLISAATAEADLLAAAAGAALEPIPHRVVLRSGQAVLLGGMRRAA